MKPPKIDTSSEGSVVLKGIYIAELARAQQYAVEAVATGEYKAAELVHKRTKYFDFPIYSITPQK